MDKEYECTVPCDDTVLFESPSAESGLLNLDTNTEVLDVCESTQCSGDHMQDYCEKEVVLDSDDEAGNQNEAVDSVNGRFPVIQRFSGRDALGLLRRQQVPAGYFRRLDNKIGDHVHLDSARSERGDGESTAGRTCLYKENLVLDSVVSKSPDRKPFSMDQVEPDYLNLVRESSTEEPLDKRNLSSHESKNIEKLAELNYVESPEAAESHDTALSFVDHYLSVCDFGSYKDIQTRKINMTKSPPSLRSNGSQSLARRVNLGSTASNLRTFDWPGKQNGKDEYTSLRMNKDSVFGSEDDKSGFLSLDQESDNVNLHNKISSLQSKEKLPRSLICPDGLDTYSLTSNDTDKIRCNSGIHMAYDSMELEKELDAGLSRQNVEEVGQFRLTPDALDIGLDTQVAAEAMEELIHAFPRFDACFTHQASENTLLESYNTLNNKGKSNHKETFVGWRCRGKRSKCIKSSTVQNKSIPWTAANQFKSHWGTVVQSLATKNSMTKKLMGGEFLNGRNAGNTRKRKCGAPPDITVQQEEYGYTERYSLKEFQKLHCLHGRRSKETTDDIRSDSSPKRREMISFHENVYNIGGQGTCLKSNFGSSFEVKTVAAKAEVNSNQDVANRTFPKLNIWAYPKGKRTHQRTPRHSIISSNQCSSPSAAIQNNVEKFPMVHEEAFDRGERLLVYSRRRKSPLGREDSGSSLKLAVDLSSLVSDSAASDRQVQSSIGSDRKKPLMKCDILDNWKPSSVDASSNMKSDSWSRRRSMISQVLKQPLSHLSRSPLMKELVRLGYTESLPDFLPKDSRRQRSMEKVCILFSQNLETSTLKQQKKIVARLGFSIASCCLDATHFVTDRFVRTRNMLEAIALGKPVVTRLWLESCEQAGYIIDERSYILRDEKKEKEIGFSMPVSLSRASRLPLLKGRRVLITPNVKPGIDVINGLVKAVQGQAVRNILNVKTKDKLVPDDLLIISCVEDYTICLQFLEKGASIYDSELLLNGIVTQKLDYERYRLFKDFKEYGHSCMS